MAVTSQSPNNGGAVSSSQKLELANRNRNIHANGEKPNGSQQTKTTLETSSSAYHDAVRAASPEPLRGIPSKHGDFLPVLLIELPTFISQSIIS